MEIENISNKRIPFNGLYNTLSLETENWSEVGAKHIHLSHSFALKIKHYFNIS